jgi:hypothetical protein
MTRSIALLGAKRVRGNPNWGKPLRSAPALLTEFEMQVERLELNKTQYLASSQLKLWCERNRNRAYIPEWLLAEWKMSVDSTFSGVA